MRLACVSLLFAFAVLTAVPGHQSSPVVAFVGVAVVDPGAGVSRPDQTVVISGDSIIAAGPRDAVAVPAGATRIDGAGRYLIPGLWDMHVHLSMTGREVLPMLLAAGVTGVRDMGGDPVVLAWRDSVAAGQLTGPRIRAAGIIVESGRWLRAVVDMTRPLGQPALLAELERRFAIDSAPDAIRAVDSLAGLGADFLKIRNYPSPAAWAALVGRARERGLRIAGHAPPFQFVRQVSDAGIASFEHSILAFRDGALREAFTGLTPAGRDSMFRAFRASGTAIDPTLVSGAARLLPDSVVERMAADPGGAADPWLRAVPARLREEWLASRALARADQTRIDWAAIHEASVASTGAMAAAGVTILAGTDLAVPPLIPGRSLVDELELLVRDAGLTPAQALAAATINPATVLPLRDRIGAIAPGRFADLVLLDADPLGDIGAVRRVRAVVAGGRYYDRRALDLLLSSAARPSR